MHAVAQRSDDGAAGGDDQIGDVEQLGCERE
jgi:hypothetical protein